MQVDAILCEHAQVADSKLFISGGGIDRSVFPADAAVLPTSFTIAAIVHVPWTHLGTEHLVEFTLVTEDGTDPLLAGPDGSTAVVTVTQGIAIRVEPTDAMLPGTDAAVPVVFALRDLPLARTGRYTVTIGIDGQPIRTLPFTVLRASG